MQKLIPALALLAIIACLAIAFMLPAPWNVVFLGACAFAAMLFATWYNADNHAMFAPNSPGRVTFKMVLINLWRDVLDLIGFPHIVDYGRRLWAFWGPRLTNRYAIGVMFTNLTIAAGGEDVWIWLAHHKLIALGVIVFNLLCPLTPPGAPSRLPPADVQPRPQEGLA